MANFQTCHKPGKSTCNMSCLIKFFYSLIWWNFSVKLFKLLLIFHTLKISKNKHVYYKIIWLHLVFTFQRVYITLKVTECLNLDICMMLRSLSFTCAIMWTISSYHITRVCIALSFCLKVFPVLIRGCQQHLRELNLSQNKPKYVTPYTCMHACM